MVSEIKKQIVNHFLEGGYLVTKDLLESLNDPEQAKRIYEAITQKDSDSEALVLNGEVRKLSDSAAVNWNEFDNAVLLSQKHKDPSISSRFLEHAEMPLIETENQLSEPPIAPKNVRVVQSYTTPPEKRAVQDFVSHFKSRYNQLSTFLKQRKELGAVLSISRVVAKHEREQVSIIGIVYAKHITKNGNIMLEVEDPTGSIKVLVNHNKPALFETAKDICLDDTIGIVGVGAGSIVFVNTLLSPSIPFKELKKSPHEEYAIFLSDLHIGSNCFLPEPFEKFLKWINGESGSDEQKTVASKVKYLFIAGDLVTGVGIYPSQEEDLEIPDIFQQYEICAAYLKRIPSHIQIIICPGNHDAVRLPEPQPVFDKHFAAPLWSIPNLLMVSNPGMVNIASTEDFSGFDVLLYHGYSFVYYADQIERIRSVGGADRADLIMQYLLERRHLAPSHTSAQYLPDPDTDPLVISNVPDFFVSGHIHKASVALHKNVTTICGSCWESQTPFEAKMGLHPQPGRVPIVNLQTRKVKILRFHD